MKVSIITVCYNSKATIEETICSVIEQTVFSQVEYIVIDGASSDGTQDIINKYRGFVSVFVSERDKGLYDAMNKGIQRATGEIIGILNSDDLFNNNQVLENITQIFQSDNEIAGVYGNITYFRSENPNKVVRFWRSKPYYATFFEDGNVPPHPSLFVRKRVYDEIGLYYPSFKISSDYELMLRMIKVYRFKVHFIDMVIVRMRWGGESTKSLRNVVIGNKEIIQSWKRNGLNLPLIFFLKKLGIKLLQLVKL
ncbi:glycosyl transferase [Chitinophaga cymbidii]|uniref:Glycosyl transferase n=2 Tax=Chitinophaga cymbidii TaxID=1096750 RepID=A0A512RGE6_9BACT|nr:glycosyl transferase [Chitinophaga cymbidii]